MSKSLEDAIVANMMARWQIGIAAITSDAIDWQQDWIEAPSKDEAQRLAAENGYYRNVRVRPA